MNISKQALQRMPYYLQFLKNQQALGCTTISAPTIAAKFNFKEIQVRKDLAAASTVSGKPKIGFQIDALIKDMENVLGYNDKKEAILVGVGSLGQALLGYKGFVYYGITIIGIFDNDPEKIGEVIRGKTVKSCDQISDFCRQHNVHLGVITVPEKQAQVVCDQLVAGNIGAIWNFAPIYLSVPENILVQNENMAASLALLSKHLKEKNM